MLCYSDLSISSIKWDYFIVTRSLEHMLLCYFTYECNMCLFSYSFFDIVIIPWRLFSDEKSGGSKDSFYEELEHVFDHFPKYDMKILLGDFNAKVGRENMFKLTIGNESLHQDSNDNGVRIVNFATSRNLVVKSMMFPNRDIHKHTWTSPDGKTYNQIDHILINRRR